MLLSFLTMTFYNPNMSKILSSHLFSMAIILLIHNKILKNIYEYTKWIKQ
jgi:hypothetical protein